MLSFHTLMTMAIMAATHPIAGLRVEEETYGGIRIIGCSSSPDILAPKTLGFVRVFGKGYTNTHQFPVVPGWQWVYNWNEAWLVDITSSEEDWKQFFADWENGLL